MDSQIVVEVLKATGLEGVDVVSHSVTPIDLESTFSSCFHNGSMGETDYTVWVFAHTSKGLVPLDCVGFKWDSNYSYSQREEHTAPSLGESLAAIDGQQPLGIIIAEKDYDDWEGGEYVNESRVTYYPWITPDFKKIRRRIEDRLRKMNDQQTLVDIAIRLGVPLT